MHALPPQPAAIAFADARHGLLGIGNEVELTADGGRTWRVVLRTPRPVVWLTDGPDGATARLDDGATLASTDGARTWRPVTVPLGQVDACPQGWSEQPRAVYENAWSLCTTQGGAGSMGKAVWRLGPHGWRRVAYTSFAPVLPKLDYGGLALAGYPLGIAMARDGFGLVWEARGTLYVTRDGGADWTGLPAVARPEVDFGRGASALPHGVGFALLAAGGNGPARLVETTDYGRTWRVVKRWP